jgi:hypothetical protein
LLGIVPVAVTAIVLAAVVVVAGLVVVILVAQPMFRRVYLHVVSKKGALFQTKILNSETSERWKKV